ncbi:diguanylate cyclase domain-containing protein [Kineococcus indalonis]|uniref:diguanylate cyclase domain-containing protein n=1 Tax=Kineococcus indalonis TaxID=2696566 RepID=UPI001412B34C|nr:diguanylate cyclase [Kineococcus indalonis]NAZ85818.1 diguanylate cyclase [Kineococcus indalonis]
MNRSRLRRAAVPAGFALLHVLAVLLGRASAVDGSLAVVWPAAGVGFVWLARSWRRPRERWRDTALLVLSGAVGQLLAQQAPLAAVLFALSGAVQALTGCWVHHRLQPRGFRLRRPGDLWALLLAVSTGAVAGGLLGTGTAAVLLGSAPGPVLLGWVVRHTASALGVAVVWLRVGDRRWLPAPAEAGRTEALLVLVGGGAFCGWLFEQPGSTPLGFLLAPFSVWVGLRLSARAAVLTTVLGDVGLVLVTIAAAGPFQHLPVRESVLDAQLLALVLIVVAVPLVLHREERQRLDAEVRAAHREAAAALEHQARHDALTGLPNRVLLRERLTGALAEGPAGVLFCDLDGFKDVNDTAGHGAGDEVLREVAARFAACVREGDTLARLGGDEFALVCPGVHDAAALDRTAARLLEALRAPVRTACGTFEVGVSVGAALAPRDPAPHRLAEGLLAAADAAMYGAKRAGKNRVHLHPLLDGRPGAPDHPGAPAPRAGAAPQAFAPACGSSSSGGTRQ